MVTLSHKFVIQTKSKNWAFVAALGYLALLISPGVPPCLGDDCEQVRGLVQLLPQGRIGLGLSATPPWFLGQGAGLVWFQIMHVLCD